MFLIIHGCIFPAIFRPLVSLQNTSKHLSFKQMSVKYIDSEITVLSTLTQQLHSVKYTDSEKTKC